MVTFNEVQAQLVELDPRFRFMGISEVRKLARLLEPREKILECMKGWHKGRATLLCATDKKIICIDIRSVEHELPHITYTDIEKVYLRKRGIAKSVYIRTKSSVIEFMLLRKKNAVALKVSIERHVVYMNNTYMLEETIVRKVEPTQYTMRNWRSLAKKVGAASIAS